MKFDCEKCGDVDAVIVDGYGFGDRLLEGVMFKVFYRDGKLTAEVMPDSANYFNDLNTKKWLAACVQYVQDMEDDVEGQCPCCDEDIYLRPDSKPRE